MKRIYIYKGFERFWHWSQAILILFLAFTGFEVHGSYSFFGYEKAVLYHKTSSILLIGLIVFAIFWHFTTSEWKQYIPTTKKLIDQILYYIRGIFKGEKHPTQKNTLSKLNPLQILVYLGFKLFLIPLIVITGLLYMFHKHIDPNTMILIDTIPLKPVALLHTLGAFLLIAFLIVHVYMTTTGHTVTSNIIAMITGYEELDEEDEINKGTKKSDNDRLLNQEV